MEGSRGIGDDGAGAPDPEVLGSSLSGDMPCVMCGYNLRGMSVTARCPECGTNVGATILALVDPLATELRPVASPRVRAVGLVMWPLAGLGAAGCCWAPRLSELWYSRAGSGVGGVPVWHLGEAAAACVVTSGIGAMSLVRPHDATPRRSVVMAGVAAGLHVPLAWVTYECERARVAVGWLAEERALLSVAECVLIGLILSLARPNARLLVTRCLALRTGRVDRQTLLAMVAAVGVAAVGTVLQVTSGRVAPAVGDWLRVGGTVAVAFGWALFSLGIAGALVDTVRIARSLVRPSPAYKDVVTRG